MRTAVGPSSQARPAGHRRGDLLKRVVLGRAISTGKHEHHLLPKVLALPVFSSDPLSSVAYATEEMMLVLAVAGAGAFGLMLPLAVVIAAVLAVVVTSYRQTVRAYPRGGGSYIVARENLGTIPGLIAAAAILQDYVLTVAVSVTAGTVAIVSAAPSLANQRVSIALGLIALIALANLRGVKEAGTLFAIPTYGFVACIYATLLSGFVQCLDGCREAASASLPLPAEGGLGLFLVLKAFSSGSTALTGVEAIADGVQAFRRPQSRNAATTLAVMGVMSISMFLGITLLARSLGVRVSEHLMETKSVLAQIGETVFSGGTMFFILQVFTALILILAANTAYQDFPRLSAILARDGFVPRQFQNRGDRLVFSNGILVLSGLAMLLVWIFDADLSRLIQLYVVGVFTAFTLSQAGMVRRWLRLKEAGWRRSVVINGVGAGATGVVLVIVAVTKFSGGAWIVIGATPLIVAFFVLVHHHYAHVVRELGRATVRFGVSGVNRVVLVLTDVDEASAEALGYIRSFRPQFVDVVYVGNRSRAEAEAGWRELDREAPPLVFLDGRDPVDAVIEHVRRVPRGPQDFVTVVIPEMFRSRSLLAALFKPVTFRLKLRLLGEPGVVIADVPVLSENGRLKGVDGRPLIPERVVALVFVAAPHDAAVRAVNYARSLGAEETRAVFLAAEPEEAPQILAKWAERGIGIQLDVVEAPFRDLAPPLLEEVRRVTQEPGTVASVIIPEFLVTRWWHRFLHNNRALFIKRALLFEPRVVLSSVPYQIGRSQGRPRWLRRRHRSGSNRRTSRTTSRS
jgi:amino acid transporter